MNYDNTPLTPLQYVLYSLLFTAVPCAGIIFAFIFAFKQDGNINLRNYARGWLLSLAIGIALSVLAALLFSAPILLLLKGLSGR